MIFVNDAGLQTWHTVCENCQYWLLLHQEHETEYQIEAARRVQKEKFWNSVMKTEKVSALQFGFISI